MDQNISCTSSKSSVSMYRLPKMDVIFEAMEKWFKSDSQALNKMNFVLSVYLRKYSRT